MRRQTSRFWGRAEPSPDEFCDRHVKFFGLGGEVNEKGVWEVD